MWGGGNESFGGGGGGGGFMPSQAGNFGSPAVGGGGEKKTKRSSNMIPVTVRQIVECEDDVLRVVDTEASVITVLGLVSAVEQTTTKVSVHIDDQTGTIECVNYVGTDEASFREIPFVPVEGTYGRVVGQMRTMKGSKYIVIFKFLPVTDMNELTCHLLEVMQVPMKLKKLKEAEALKTGVGMGVGAPAMGNSLVTNALTNSMMMGGGTGAGAGMPNRNQPKVGNPTQQAVLLAIQNNTADTGMHKEDILRQIPGKIEMKVLEKILEDLSGEGHIYSTVDDDHFKSTD